MGLIRVGVVSKVNWKAGTVDVVFQDSDNMVSSDILVVDDYDLPNIDDIVLVAYLSKDTSRGYVIGRPLYKLPTKAHENVIVKVFGSDSIMYDKSTRTMTIDIPNVVINGSISITGNLTVKGSISEVNP